VTRKAVSTPISAVISKLLKLFEHVVIKRAARGAGLSPPHDTGEKAGT
jgi:hypothetical protein